MELNKVLEQVRKLTAMAENMPKPGNTTEEAEAILREAKSAGQMADALMIKYAIDQAALRAAAPADQQIKPVALSFEVGNALSGLSQDLAYKLAAHNRCQIRFFTTYDRERRDYVRTGKVYGYEHDVKFFELQYTTIRLHMVEILRPRFEASRTFDENCFALHEAGYNWLEMAKLQGWEKASLSYLTTDELISLGEAKEAWRQKETGEVRSNTKLGSAYKRAYNRECAARGVATTVIQASNSQYYRQDAAQGYITQIGIRLRMLARSRETGTALVLGTESVLDYFREENAELFHRCPKCAKLSDNAFDCDRCGHHIKDYQEVATCPKCAAAKSGACRDHPRGSYRYRSYNDAAYDAGRRHANSADLSGNARTGTAAKRELG